LSRLAKEELPNQAAFYTATQRASNWLLEQLEPDFSWKKHAYVPGFTPAYYSRAVQGLLYANQVLHLPEITRAIRPAMQYYAAAFNVHKSFNDWGFRPGSAAFTHTIAYTLEGFWESAVMLQAPQIQQQVKAVADHFLDIRAQNAGKTAGRYTSDWRGDYSFICVCGHAQLSVFFQKLYVATGNEKYKAASRELLMETLTCQNLTFSGGLPGSKPFWGAYMPFSYPNWAAKFFLDAMLLIN
jgi:hypothetical protein